MNRLTGIVVAAFVITIAAFTASGDMKDNQKPSFLSAVSVGQTVSMKEVAGRFEISIIEEGQLNQKVTAVGSDYLMVEDIAGVTEIRIPAYSIKSVVTISKRK